MNFKSEKVSSVARKVPFHVNVRRDQGRKPELASFTAPVLFNVSHQNPELVPVFFCRPTNTSESLRTAAVPIRHHQWQEVDLTEALDGSIQKTAAAEASAQRPARPPVGTKQPLWTRVVTLQLVLTATLQSQRQTLLT